MPSLMPSGTTSGLGRHRKFISNDIFPGILKERYEYVGLVIHMFKTSANHSDVTGTLCPSIVAVADTHEGFADASHLLEF